MKPLSLWKAALIFVAIVLGANCAMTYLLAAPPAPPAIRADGGGAAAAQSLPPDDAGCTAAIGKGEVRMFANLLIPPTFQNQTPPRWKCQAEQRAMPICPRPYGRACIAVWAVDPQTHENIAGVRFTIDGTSKTTGPSGLVTFTPLRNDPMKLTMDSVPTAYTKLGIPFEKQVTTFNGLVVAEMTKK